MKQLKYNDHCEEGSVVDPDNGISWHCSACTVPIFSTPFVEFKDESSGKVTYLHDQCANLPKELMVSDLHPKKPLLLEEEGSISSRCDACGEKCGTMVYRCPDAECRIELDVLCALPTPIKILHMSHPHRLMVVRGAEFCSFVCSACGTDDQHDHVWSSTTSPDVVYMCKGCRFWIHPFCATLPNAIVLRHKHQHPLLLSYDHPNTTFMRDNYSNFRKQIFVCAICKHVIRKMGVYSCNKCHYYVHIMCAVSQRHGFKPVLIREAKLPDLARFPIPDEHTSVIRYITSTIISTTTVETSNSDVINNDDDDDQKEEDPLSSDDDSDEQLVPLPLDQYSRHEHQLILQNQDDEDDEDEDCLPHVCNACVQIISPPLYKCSECPNFFLHDACTHLPLTLPHHPTHTSFPHDDHPLSLVPNTAGDSISRCNSCHRPCNGFTYSCPTTKRWPSFHLDILCSLMPASFTHDAHGRAHILYSTSYQTPAPHLRTNQIKSCDCCGDELSGLDIYKCWTCHSFNLHYRCALLPNTITHRFDPHPLNLITNKQPPCPCGNQQQTVVYCEICEQEIEYSKIWYYGCHECDQSFHTDCIPCLDHLSMIRFGASSTITVELHKCPLLLVRGTTVWGYRCGFCKKIFNENDNLAWECNDCNFRIHHQCARPNDLSYP